MRIRNISIEEVEYEGSYACDVVITFAGGGEMTVPTKLHRNMFLAFADAKRIQRNFMDASSDELGRIFEEYSLRTKNPFREILDSIPENFGNLE